jgi:regulator of protease activity HflC (stomatin/prohibitin superfamily)
VDPVTVVKAAAWHDRFYLAAQLVLRNAISTMTLERTLSGPASIDTSLTLALSPVADELGLNLRSAAVRDFAVRGELKRAVADVVAARLSGQAALERARSETGAIRSLANAAQAVANNPVLLQLRLIQQMETSSGNT